MNKIWSIAWKDTIIRYRDRNALIFSFFAPLLLAGIMGAAFGGGGDESPLRDIPIAVVNEDEGERGQLLIDILNAESDEADTPNNACETGDNSNKNGGGLAELLAVSEIKSVEAGIAGIEQGDYSVVIHIPANFSDAMGNFIPGSDDTPQDAVVTLYTDPTRQISPVIVRGIVDQIVVGFNEVSLSIQIGIDQLTNDYAPDLGFRLFNLGTAIPEEFEQDFAQRERAVICLNTITSSDDGIDPIVFFAPSMAIFFLMFSMMDGSRSILDERLAGTLDRLLSTPTTAMQVVAGKILGTFIIGVIQMAILIIASAILFQLSWGNSILGIVVMTIAVVAAATSLGTLIASFGRDPNQIQIIGTAVTLLFSMLGGNFIQAQGLPDWMQPISKLTLNRWAMDGFSNLVIDGEPFRGIVLEASVLLGMAVLFFALGVWQFHKQLMR